MRLAFLPLALCLSAPAAFGCTSTVSTGSGGTGGGGGAGGGGGTSSGGGGAGGSAACEVPTETVPLSVPEDPSMPTAIHEADGTYAATADGFTVDTATETVYFFGVDPGVPEGTFVHITYAVTQGFYGPPGAFVLIENLPMLGGDPNPTEATSRLWYFAASGGGAPAAMAPFSPVFDALCSVGDFETGTNEVETLALSGDGFSVTVLPGEQATFTAASGEDAGAYAARNVNIQWIGAAGGDAWSITNFTIARAD